MNNRILGLILLIPIGLTSSLASAQAADGTWTNVNGGSWANAANWSAGLVAGGAGSTADFSTLNLTSHAYVTLDGDRTVGNLVFADTVSTNYSWLLEPGTGGTMTLATSTGTPTVYSEDNAFFNEVVVDGTQGFTKTGLGDLKWVVAGSNYNSITGTINVSEGTLRLIAYDGTSRFFADTSTLPSFSVENGAKLYVQTRNPFYCYGPNGWDYIPVTLNGGTLETTSYDLFLDDVTMNAAPSMIINDNNATVYVGSSSTLWSVGAAASGSTVSGSSPLTMYSEQGDWAFELNVARGAAAQDLTINSVMQDHSTRDGLTLLKSGNGILSLTAANTYSGDTKIEGGTLSISNPYLQNSSDVYIETGACLDLEFTGTDTISAFYIDGEAAALGTWGAVGSAADHTSSMITGTGLLNVTAESTPRYDWEVGTPIATWGGGAWTMTDETAQHVVDGNFNVAYVTSPETMDMAEQYGLRARLLSALPRDPATLDDPEKRSQLDALVDRFKQCSTAYSYFIKDEPHASEFAGLARMVEYLRLRDPDRMPFINLYPLGTSSSKLGTSGGTVTSYQAYLDQYINTVQPAMLSYDHYPFKETYDHSRYLQNLQMVATAAHDAGIPFMQITQAAAWESDWRVPNEHELRYLTYTTLAYGAQGIFWWPYSPQDGPETGGLEPFPNGTDTAVFNAVKTLNPQFVEIATETQGLQWLGTYLKGYYSSYMPPGTITLPGDATFDISSVLNNKYYWDGDALEGVLFGLFGDDEGIDYSDASHVLVVNLDYSESKTYTLSGSEFLSVFDATTGLWTDMGDDEVVLNLLPGGGILVAMTSALSSLPGDADRNGYVDEADAAILAANWLNTNASWSDGDFNGDGKVNDVDATLLAANWSPAPSASVPEPGTIIMLLTATLMLTMVRRKKLNYSNNNKGN